MPDTSQFEKMERDGWNNPAIAKGYADGFQFANRVTARELAESVQAGPGTMALDLCTGNGAVAAALAAQGATVTGLDFSAAMIALAQAEHPDITFVQGDAMSMAFADHSFDTATIGFGIPHLPDPARGLTETARVLRPGGRLAFSIWHGKGSDGAFGWLFDAVGRLGDPTIVLPQGPDAHMLTDLAVAEPMAKEAGFEHVQLCQVETEIWVETPNALFDAFDQGAVRAAMLLSGQTPDRRDRIRADLAHRVLSEGITYDGGYRVPAPSVVISAQRLQ